MQSRNKLKLIWPLLAIVSLCLLCCACASAASTIEQIIPIIGGIVGIVGAAGEAVLPTEASLISSGVTLVQNGLTALVNSIKTYETNKTATGALATLQAVFTSVQQNLSSLLSAAQVKDTTTAQKVTAVVNAAVSTVGVVEASIVAQAPTTPASSS